MSAHRVALATAATITGVLIACAKPREAAVGSLVPAPAPATQAGELACAPNAAKLATGTTVTSMAGTYRITLVATSGLRTGGKASGTLTLREYRGSPAETPSLPGDAQIALDSVGAVAPGARSVGSYDVTALQWKSTSGGVVVPEITIRFGTIAAPGTTTPIEGAHTALYLNTLSAGDFTGRWSSGSGDAQSAGSGGYFCASRAK